MQERLEGTNQPKITTYQMFDSPSLRSTRGTTQRIPMAEVAPQPKPSTSTDGQITDQNLKKLESLRMIPNYADFHHIRYVQSFSLSR